MLEKGKDDTSRKGKKKVKKEEKGKKERTRKKRNLLVCHRRWQDDLLLPNVYHAGLELVPLVARLGTGSDALVHQAVNGVAGSPAPDVHRLLLSW